MLMRVALPIWEERISPVFDVASRILLVDVDRQTLGAREERRLAVTDPRARVETMIAWRVEVLICGAISRVIEQMLTARDVRVLGRVCGVAEEVLQAYVTGQLDAPRFRLPGEESPGRGGGRGRGSRRGRRRRANYREVGRGGLTSCEDIIVREEDMSTILRSDGSPAGGGQLTLHETDETRAWVAEVGDDVAGSLVLRRWGDIGRISELSIALGWEDGPVACRLVQKALGYCREQGLLKLTLAAAVRSQRIVRLFRCLGFQGGRERRHRGAVHPLEFYVDLYRQVDEDRCADEAADSSTEPRE